jgi:hypothetical protein
MKKLFAIFILVFIFFNNSNAQNVKKAIHIKLNTLNFLLTYPSVSAEFQVGKKSSLQLRAFYADFVFISRDRMGAMGLSFRKYLGQQKGINGFYGGVGIDNHFDMDNYFYTNKFNTKTDYGIGPQFAVGYQTTTYKRWVFDFGLSYSVYFNSNSTGAGIIAGIGYKISK